MGLRQHQSGNCTERGTSRSFSLPIRSTRKAEKPLIQPPTQQPLPEFKALKITWPESISDPPAFTEIRRSIWYPEDWPTKKPIYWPREWPYPADPTLRQLPTDDPCCSDTALECKCYREIVSSTHRRIKIENVGAKGYGVRAIVDIAAKTGLGKLVGLIKPRSATFDKRWAVAIVREVTKGKFGPECEEILGFIDCKDVGNWVRYLNHSCGEGANARLYGRWLEGKWRIILETTRKILAHEEILIDYGPEYWKGRKCLCGNEKCYNPAVTNPASQVKRSTCQAKRQILVSYLNLSHSQGYIANYIG